MIQKFFVVIVCFFLLSAQACYTISHPEPCPGLVEVKCDAEEEI